MSYEVDQRLNILAESVARRLTRRRILATAVKGAFAAVAGVAAGVGLTAMDVEAACTCEWAQGRNCNSSTSTCPYNGGCKPGYSICTSADWCSGWCPYTYGSWTSCSGLGGGLGYKICTDCKSNTRGCGFLCTCLSGCINCTVSPEA
jgi:hypothetical protein